MTARRGRGVGSLYWDDQRQRWRGEITVGYDARGKRITRKASGKTKTEARNKLKEIQRDYEEGLIAASAQDTVADGIAYWLAYGLNGRDERTIDMYRTYAETHIIPALGKRPLRELTVDEVEKFLAGKSAVLSTRSLLIMHSILRRAFQKAQARDKIRLSLVTSVP